MADILPQTGTAANAPPGFTAWTSRLKLTPEEHLAPKMKRGLQANHAIPSRTVYPRLRKDLTRRVPNG